MKKLIALLVIVLLSISLSSCDQLVTLMTREPEVNTSATAIPKATTVKSVETTKATTAAATTAAATTAETTMPSVEDLMKICETYDYKTVARSPDEYAKKFMKISGKIIQIIEDGDNTGIRLAEDSDSDKMWFFMYVRPEGAPRVLEDDIVTVYAYCTGLYSYKSTLGATISIPGAVAMQIVIENL